MQDSQRTLFTSPAAFIDSDHMPVIAAEAFGKRRPNLKRSCEFAPRVYFLTLEGQWEN